MYPLSSLVLNFLTSELGGEEKLLSSSVSLEFSVPHKGYISQSLCSETPPLCPQVLRKGPQSFGYLVGEGVILVLFGG